MYNIHSIVFIFFLLANQQKKNKMWYSPSGSLILRTWKTGNSFGDIYIIFSGSRVSAYKMARRWIKNGFVKMKNYCCNIVIKKCNIGREAFFWFRSDIKSKSNYFLQLSVSWRILLQFVACTVTFLLNPSKSRMEFFPRANELCEYLVIIVSSHYLTSFISI